MPITVNEGGVLYELETVTSNESGVLYELDTVHANEGGVLHEIHSAVSFPDSLKWEYSSSAAKDTPTVSDNGMTVSNSRSSSVCNSVSSNVLEIKGTVKITLYFSHSIRASGGSGGCSIFDVNTGNSIGGFSLMLSGSRTETYTLTTGQYRIGGGGGSGNQSGNYANDYTISVSFSK